ncbi:urea carboxylase [Pseudohyphozyma bogoriensis]|nr:urea carboxylase [Pseudohyphozyma bogoriensis]
MPHKLLIANRGEIALRILRSAKELDIPTLAPFTDADATCKIVALVDEAVPISSYTDQDALLRIARECEATMVHPGYGFLSENHDFATKVEAAGLIWLGPRSELVDSLELALAQAEIVGYPIMLKATGGGGGMGMVVCSDASELRKAYASTVEMTKNLFSNAGVFVEKFIPKARHIEIQVFGDGEGNVLDFGERECSVQRRHQKVIEEGGSPFISRHPALGREMRLAAVNLCKLISYRSAGTVEFLVDDTTAKFYFLELNSRIQVEHAVTESVRPGLDLVGMMIRLGLSSTGAVEFQLPPAELFSEAQGHAIEARIYAEIPHLGFKPAPGLLQEVSFPSAPWLRVDSWVETGSFVSPFYDPMIAKVIAHGATREESRQRLDDALASTVLLGTSTNVAYVRAILNCEAFVAGDVTTKFLDTFPYVSSCVEVVDGGLSTSVQDLIPRLSGDGIPRGGPMDELAFQAANGARVYLAIRGGFPAVPAYMGSKSTFGPGKFGGFQGRDLAPGDVLTLSTSSAPSSVDRELAIPSSLHPTLPQTWNLAALAGPHADISYLTAEDIETLFSAEYTVTADTNRLGIRLDPSKRLKFSRPDGGAGGGHPSNTIDHAYCVGNLNMNGDTPVLFTCDGPDAGGFACVLGVVSSDLWKFGQIRPGDKLYFVSTSEEAILEQRLRQTAWISAIQLSIAGAPVDTSFSFPLDLPKVTAPAPVDGVLQITPADSSLLMPTLSYRQCGDGGILVEVGAQECSFQTRVITELWERRIRAQNLKGVNSVGQGAASILLRYDPLVLTQSAALSILVSTSHNLGIESQEVAIPCRRVYLPTVFDDALGRDTIARYSASSGRTKAVYLPSNLKYLAEASGSKDVEGMLSTFCSTDWYVSARAFFCGLPMMQPLDQRACLASQKYNPSRTYTPAGTLGFAGSACAIYPVDSPGGYQILGRTLTPWKLWAEDYEGHFLLKSFDLVRWVPTSEEEFTKIETEFKQGTYKVQIEEISVSAKEVAALEASTLAEVEELKLSQRRNLTRLAVEETKLFEEWKKETEAAAALEGAGRGSATGQLSGTPLKSPVLAVVRGLEVQVGDVLSADMVVARVEAMKTEITIKVPRRLVGLKVTGVSGIVGETVQAGEPLLYCA